MLSRQKYAKNFVRSAEGRLQGKNAKKKVADYSTTMLYNVLTVRNLLSVCFKRLQGQLLRLTTLRCRDEATRTPDPYVPNVVRYQLRYIPIFVEIGCKGTAFFSIPCNFWGKNLRE